MIFKTDRKNFYLPSSSCLEFDCPGDGTCSSQGICDNARGSCICNDGFEGNTCKGSLWYF